MKEIQRRYPRQIIGLQDHINRIKGYIHRSSDCIISNRKLLKVLEAEQESLLRNFKKIE